jgi:hypothetical protein
MTRFYYIVSNGRSWLGRLRQSHHQQPLNEKAFCCVHVKVAAAVYAWFLTIAQVFLLAVLLAMIVKPELLCHYHSGFVHYKSQVNIAQLNEHRAKSASPFENFVRWVKVHREKRDANEGPAEQKSIVEGIPFLKKFFDQQIHQTHQIGNHKMANEEHRIPHKIFGWLLSRIFISRSVNGKIRSQNFMTLSDDNNRKAVFVMKPKPHNQDCRQFMHRSRHYLFLGLASTAFNVVFCIMLLAGIILKR